MRLKNLVTTLVLLLPLAACTQNETVAPPAAAVPDAPDQLDQPDPPHSGTTLRELSGLWLLESGSMMSDFVAGLATFTITADVTAIRIGNDGTGNVWLRDRLTGTKDCVQAYVIFDDTDGSLAFDFAAEKTTDVIFNVALERYTYVYPFVTVENGWLGIADAEGQIAIFSNQVSLPGDVTCDQFDIAATYDVPSPQYFGDLVYYVDQLIFNSNQGQIEAFDLLTDTLGSPLGPTSSRLVQTAQSWFFWTHCGCGGSRDAFMRNLASVFDTVSSEDEMGGPITFRAMAYLPTTDRLWLHGRPFEGQYGQFFIMDTSGEPDVIDDTIAFNRDLRGLAFDGTDLWGIVTVASQSVVRIDPLTGDVLQSFEVPDVDVSWSGIESVGGEHLYMLGTDLEGNGVLYKLTTDIALGVPDARTAGTEEQSTEMLAAFEARFQAQVAGMAMVQPAE